MQRLTYVIRLLTAIALLPLNTYSQVSDSILLKTSGIDTIAVNTCISISESYSKTSKDTAHFWIDKAILKAQEGASKYRGEHRLKLNMLLSKSYRKKVDYFFNEGKYDTAYTYSQLGVSLLEKICSDFKQNIPDYIVDEQLYWWAMHGTIAVDLAQYNEALIWLTKSYTGDSIRNDYDNMVKDLISIGNAYLRQSNYSSASAYYFKSLKLADSLQNYTTDPKKEKVHKEGIAKIYNNIGNIHFTQKNYSLAKSYYKKSLTIKESFVDKMGICNSYLNLSNINWAEETYDSALYYCNIALDIAKELNNKSAQARILANIGAINRSLKNYSIAEQAYLNSIEIRKGSNDLDGMSQVIGNLAILYGNMEQLDKAQKYALESLEMAKKIGVASRIRNNFQTLIGIMEEKGDYKKAFEYQEKYIAINDSIFNIEKSKQITQLEIEYKTEKKQKELVLLEKENEIMAISLRNRTTMMLSLLGGFIALAIIAVLLLNNIKHKRKTNELLSFQNNEIEMKNEELQQQKEEILSQRDEIESKRSILQQAYNHIEEKNRQITDSIDYAKRIHEAILPPVKLVEKLFPKSFLINLPKDIVSGDFYWIESTEGGIIAVLADCTGHGVPGAFMSLLGMTTLRKVIRESGILEPDKICVQLHQEIRMSLNQSQPNYGIKENIDLTVAVFNLKDMKLNYSGMHSNFFYIRNGLVERVKTNPLSFDLSYTKKWEMKLNPGDRFVFFTDGYIDQMKENTKEKIKYSGLKELLTANHQLSMNEIGDLLMAHFMHWKDQGPQVDDVMVLGLEV